MRIPAAIILFLPSISIGAPVDISKDLSEFLDKNFVPGLTAAAVVKDQIVARGSAGVRKRNAKTRVTINDKFHIGSNTKSMTATLAALLVREKKITWDTTVSEAFKGMDIGKDFSTATLEQLLSNTAGCPGDFPPADWKRVWALKGPLPERRLEMAEMILDKAPAYPPGKGYAYSNAGFSIGGAMLEQAAGKDYEELLTKFVFKPLEMNSAGFRAPGVKGKTEQPYGHRPAPGRDHVSSVAPGPQADNPHAIAPAGAVHCSILDLAKYARAHLGHGPKGFLSKEELANLHRPRSRGGQPYALGWSLTKDEQLVHVGSNTMWYCYIFVDRKREFAVVAAANSGAGDAFRSCSRAANLLIGRFAPK